ncbi:SUMF1/EgtB/PvdO family nonheme iron enzyme [Treponema socranskii]|uniref:SUMF1/EgtB/PvdO family nonheme iron enzyme n=1 Tax=Treponema socranskii TaxID=53419 RepID=UPI00287131D1|nr:SUMF1/EgtB/PvdO family nonheme iron enzyme [Treponema socranskii]MDR9859818.1 SUMF1/EgtB/PvdO family nonheme iron enzyme [Treponema socranskii]
MKALRKIGIVAAIAVIWIAGCKNTVEVEKEKSYASAVTFKAEDAGKAGVKITMATATEGASIFYTTDGKEPNAKSVKYSAPLTFDKDVEIKAIAVKDGIENSPVSVGKVSIKTKTVEVDESAPAAVTNLTATAKDSRVLLTWTDASDSDIYGYEVSYSGSAPINRAALPALNVKSMMAPQGAGGCYVSGLTNGTEYTFTVRTMDTSGNKSGGVTAKATPVAVSANSPMTIALSVPDAATNTNLNVKVEVTTAAELKKVVYKKGGSVNAKTLLSDTGAYDVTESVKSNGYFTVTAASEADGNGTYTVAVLDESGREETEQITIGKFDFTPPSKVKNVSGIYSDTLHVIILNWTNPSESDFDHVEISYTTNDGTTDSARSQAESVNGATKTFTGIDATKAYYTYYIASVDKLGNKSAEVKHKVGVQTGTSNPPEGFVEVPGTSIAGTESWIPSSEVFLSGRVLEINSFYMSDHEVTRAEYKEVIGSDPSIANAYDKDGHELTGDAAGKNPVNGVSWYDALVYCNKLSIKESLTPCYTINSSTNPDDWGAVPTSSDSTWNAATCDFDADGYRLPTEAEWEWAARGGENYTYAGSNDVNEVAWYTSNTNDTGTRDVKTKKKNGYGLYDMSGNVWEWCWDRYGNISNTTPNTGSASGSSRCQRGGSWCYNAYYAQVANRNCNPPGNRSSSYGLRLVRSAH